MVWAYHLFILALLALILIHAHFQSRSGVLNGLTLALLSGSGIGGIGGRVIAEGGGLVVLTHGGRKLEKRLQRLYRKGWEWKNRTGGTIRVGGLERRRRKINSRGTEVNNPDSNKVKVAREIHSVPPNREVYRLGGSVANWLEGIESVTLLALVHDGAEYTAITMFTVGF